jgi:KDO2-lipid IV(A) palmitoleoyltransferase
MIAGNFESLGMALAETGIIGWHSPVIRPPSSSDIKCTPITITPRCWLCACDRRDLRGMVQALKQGEAVWFAPDQDYGPKGSVFFSACTMPRRSRRSIIALLDRMRPLVCAHSIA